MIQMCKCAAASEIFTVRPKHPMGTLIVVGQKSVTQGEHWPEMQKITFTSSDLRVSLKRFHSYKSELHRIPPVGQTGQK